MVAYLVDYENVTMYGEPKGIRLLNEQDKINIYKKTVNLF